MAELNWCACIVLIDLNFIVQTVCVLTVQAPRNFFSKRTSVLKSYIILRMTFSKRFEMNFCFQPRSLNLILICFCLFFFFFFVLSLSISLLFIYFYTARTDFGFPRTSLHNSFQERPLRVRAGRSALLGRQSAGRRVSVPLASREEDPAPLVDPHPKRPPELLVGEGS